jgi:predicted 2-oxoglutarate/Fe(II)-dependent dioxygenase YbiX
MKSNLENYSLKSFIHVESGLIPKEICDFVIDSIKEKKWSKHEWGDGKTIAYSYPTKELDVLYINEELENILNPFVSQSIKSYNNFLGEENVSKVRYFSPIRFNRYKKNQIMRKHSDHITSLFDGESRGIPVLSIIINFNDDYENGELIFWDDYKIDLGVGDVVIFPSLFLFPHRVKEVTKNIRYSGVCWGW